VHFPGWRIKKAGPISVIKRGTWKEKKKKKKEKKKSSKKGTWVFFFFFLKKKNTAGKRKKLSFFFIIFFFFPFPTLTFMTEEKNDKVRLLFLRGESLL
jgi:hypothetical protein